MAKRDGKTEFKFKDDDGTEYDLLVDYANYLVEFLESQKPWMDP